MLRLSKKSLLCNALLSTLLGYVLLTGPFWSALAQQQGQNAPPRESTEQATPSPTELTGPEASRYLTVLQTDKPIYRVGEQVYIRGVLLHHAKRTPYGRQNEKSSQQGQNIGVLKVTGPKGETVATLGLREEDGVWGTGWNIPTGAAGGEYRLEAMYPLTGFPGAERTIDVRAYRAPRLKTQIKFVRDGYGPGDTVTATLEVERAAGGTPVGAPVKVQVRVDGAMAHEGEAEVGADGRCLIKFPLPDKIERGEGTLALVIQDGDATETAAKTIPILLQSVDMHFYPEGGDLVAGLKSRVYFEAFTPAGKPADLAGAIVDDQGKQVAEFRSEHEGRGRFSMTPVSGRTYKAVIAKPSGIAKPVALPEVADDGISLTASKEMYGRGGRLKVKLASSRDQTVKVVLRKRDRELAIKTVDAANEPTNVVLDLGDQPHADGVLVVTAYDQKGQPRAERLLFREPAEKLEVKLTPEAGAGLAPGGKVRMKVETFDSQGEPVEAVVGLAVTDESVLEMVDRREQAPLLPAAVLLEPEVKELADAHVYFDPQRADAPLAVDLLLGVQGWRRFALVNLGSLIRQYPLLSRQAFAIGIPLNDPLGTRLSGRFGVAGEGALEGRDLMFWQKFQNEVAKKAPAAVEEAEEDSKGEPQAEAPAEPADREEGGLAGKKERVLRLNKDLASLPRRRGADRAPMAAPLLRELQQVGQGAAEGGKLFDGPAAGGFADFFRAIPLDLPAISVRVYQHRVRPNRQPGERVDFAETLYWNVAVKTNAEGAAHVEFGLNDSVTSFRVAADAVTQAGVLGAATTTIESLEPFYLEPKLPLEVSMGDMIQTPVGIVNSTGEQLGDVKIQLATDSLEAGAAIAPFTLKPGDRIRKRVNIHVGDFVGESQLTLSATSGAYRDQVTRTLRVAPLGFPYEMGSGALLSAGGVFARQVKIPKDVGGLAAAPDMTRASYLFFLKPVIAALLAVILLNDSPTLLQILAILVVTGSVFVEIYGSRLSNWFQRA